MTTRRPSGLTIGDVAAFAGVTVRAVRHYHQRGLLPEPVRDGSGYRRYDATAVVDLIRIKALSEAGVPLARVRELLSATREEFTRALADIDTQLGAEIGRLDAHRRAIKDLASADALALPDEVVAYLADMRDHGLSERMVANERDQWLLISAHAPDQVHAWVTQKAAWLDDAEYLDVYRALDEAFDWQPSDPRMEDLARDLRALFERYGEPGDPNIDDTLAAMLDTQSIGASAGWRRLNELLGGRDPVV